MEEALDRAFSDDGMDSPRATDSPRSQVFSKFGKMDLHEKVLRSRGSSISSQMHVQQPDTDSDIDMNLDDGSPRKRRRTNRDEHLRPQDSQMLMPVSPPLSPASLHLPSPVQAETPLPSTPVRTPASSPLKPTLTLKTKAISPLRLGARKVCRRRRSPSPDSGTWHVSEITGHMIDATCPDDRDGLGINGIGFEPTREEAERRRARRKEQVAEWRRREEKDERRRRAERRRGMADEERRVGRGVRFAVG